MTLTAAPIPAATRTRARHTLLVVDDEPDVVKSVKDLFRLDYKVLTATSAAEALGLLEREPVHVLMTDQRMPEMTGVRSEEHTSELQSRQYLVCRLLLEKKKKK